MTQLAALIGILTIIVAIPFGLMLGGCSRSDRHRLAQLRHVGGAVERPLRSVGEPA